jgi:peroxiredoxin
MMQLHQGYKEFEDRNTVILVIGPDNVERVKKYWEENDLKFYGLPDEEHKVLKLYGQKVDIFRLGRLPAQILVDKEGNVRYIHYGKSMSDIPENNEIFELIDKL